MTPILTFRLPPQYLKAAAMFISTDETRFVLNGVQVEIVDDKTILLVATDGRRLFVVNVAGEAELIEWDRKPVSFIIPKTLLTRLPKTDKLGLRLDLLKGDIESKVGQTIRIASFVANSFAVEASPIEGRYPDWRKAVPTNAATLMDFLSIRGRLFDSFAKVNALLDKHEGLRIRQHGDGGAYSILPSRASARWAGVLRPVRVTNNSTIPNWMLPKPSEPSTQPAE